jgi:hypothetical protein
VRGEAWADKRLLAAGVAGLLMMPRLAAADPWIPPAGTGTVKPMVRLFNASRAFSGTGFTTSTQPSSTESETQFRATGEQGLGHGFSLEYDLRAGFLSKSRLKHKQRLTNNSSGLEDEVIGLNYGLTQTRAFADSVTLNVVIPAGATTPNPQLGTGHWAIEPDYQIGARFARGHGIATLALGDRHFFDSGANQWRGFLELGFSPIRLWNFATTAFYVRTTGLPPTPRVIDLGERYNLLRLGIVAQYELTKALHPFIAFEKDIAGKDIHSGRRITIGMAIHY